MVHFMQQEVVGNLKHVSKITFYNVFTESSLTFLARPTGGLRGL